MCESTNTEAKKSSQTQTKTDPVLPPPTESPSSKETTATLASERKKSDSFRKRRSKREKQAQVEVYRKRYKAKRKLQSRHQQRNKQENNDGSGGITAILPSLGLLVVGIFAYMAKMGFRGRPTTAGIDLGTTNSVICVQSPSKSVGEIECIRDPFTNSPIVPSVVSFLDKPLSSTNKNLKTPSSVVVGEQAKRRIDAQPKSTFYHSKRVIGRSYDDPAIAELRHEVQFQIEPNKDVIDKRNGNTENNSQDYSIPESEILFHSTKSGYKTPTQISSYVLTFLLDIASQYSPSYSSLTSAVIAIPAEFSMNQRVATIQAFKEAGIKVARVLEEPTAAALAYGLDQKEGVEHILVYDFGGGTLDVSVLRVSPDGYVEVMASAGDSNLGGVDFDTRVADYLLQKEEDHVHFLEEGDAESEKLEVELETCGSELNVHPCTVTGIRILSERMKIELSKLHDLETKDEILVKEQCLTHKTSNTFMKEGFDCSQLLTQTIQLSLDEYDTAVSDLYPRSALPITNVLKDLNMQIEDIDEVVMVGGTTRMPQVRNLVKDIFSGVIEELNTEIDPDLTVAYGAASVID